MLRRITKIGSVLMLTACLLGGCESKKFSREDAAGLLQKDPGFAPKGYAYKSEDRFIPDCLNWDSVRGRGTRKLVEVTGVSQSGETTARVTFTWTGICDPAAIVALQRDMSRFGNPPDRATKDCERFAQQHPGDATFQRFDDGWRLQGVLY
jgi:hypothetical protein